MMKVTAVVLSFILTGFAFAAEDPKEVAAQIATLADSDSVLYDMQYVFAKKNESFHAEHFIKFSICQDETMAQCEEFATDKYLAYKNLDAYLQNNIKETTVDVSPLKMVYQAEPNLAMDELVKQSVYDNDRRFAHIG